MGMLRQQHDQNREIYQANMGQTSFSQRLNSAMVCHVDDDPALDMHQSVDYPLVN